MNKNNTDEKSVKNTEDNDDVKESVHQPQKRSKTSKRKKVISLILFLLVAAATSYVITPFVLPYFADSSVVDQDEIDSTLLRADELPAVEASPAPEATPPAPESSNQEEILEIKSEQPQSDIHAPSQATEVLQEIVEPQPVLQQIVLKPTRPHQSILKHKAPRAASLLFKVVQLYEAVQNGQNCRPQIEALTHLNTQPELANKLLDIMPVCLEEPLPTQIKQAFYKNKKRAIWRILQKDNTTFGASLQMIPYVIFDIQKKVVSDPDAPMDVLYQIQNAVEANQPSQILDLIGKLPENVQAALYDLQQAALRQTTIQTTLQELIQTMATQGGEQ